MPEKRQRTLDANEAVAEIAYRVSEVIAIYPITPSSAMGEHCDEWAAKRRKNIWDQSPRIIEMQSEGGAAGAVHGALQAGSLTTTFTASQGLLLMIPNLFKIAGELLPFTMHVAARTIATHALSIFGDHSDVMSCRSTGMAMLASGSVQEAQDFAAIAHAATLRSRIPFIHFFDGFRTSHEIAKIDVLDDEILRALLDHDAIAEHRRRGLNPDHPVIRGTTQNPDAFFQAREAANLWYKNAVVRVRETMEKFAELTGRSYDLFEYVGHPEAERVIIAMGSGAECIHETVERLVEDGEKVGLVKVRLYRPFDTESLARALPKTTKSIAVLDRTKEPGAGAEPLYLDILSALEDARAEGLVAANFRPRLIGGRYGLSSKEFTPAMVEAVFAETAKAAPKRRFTIGINDDVSKLSLEYDASRHIESADVRRALFFGLGSDGTVSSNKNSIKIIGEETDLYAQGYFVYDSRKAGAVTISHLRFGPRPIRSSYLIERADFIACHQPQLIERFAMLDQAQNGAIFVQNTSRPAADAFAALPIEYQTAILEKRIRYYVIDAQRVAEEAGLGRYISTVMQAVFFALSGVLDRETAIKCMRDAVQKTYGKRGVEVVKRNLLAIDRTLDHLFEVEIPGRSIGDRHLANWVPDNAPDFVKRVTGLLLAGHGDQLPVSAFPVDGTWPVGTAIWDRRSLALELPVWDKDICIQCNKCALICPHAAIRTLVYDAEHLDRAPAGFKSQTYREAGATIERRFTVQVAPDDCTGCGLCVAFCPAKDKSNPRHKAIDMTPAAGLKEKERPLWDFFAELPYPDRSTLTLDNKGTQFLEPLFEFSGACAGCGETPYLKLMSQLFGDRAIIANATGCSSIYGGNLPTTPWKTNADGRGPAWCNSLFEDNAEFGLGIRLGADALRERASILLRAVAAQLPGMLVDGLFAADQSSEAGIAEQRARVADLKKRLSTIDVAESRSLFDIADYLVKKSVWIVGGDGWAYDIGYGGLDHVLATGANVNVLVLDTEVYSNTGGQQSKATPMGAAAKFATNGKEVGKKDLGLLAMSYGHVYVARIAMGAKDAQTVRAFVEAESWNGPSLIIAYSHCIAHGYDLKMGADQQRLAVDSGVWPLYRFDPRRLDQGEKPLVLDSPAPKRSAREYMRNEGRFRMVELADPARYESFLGQAERAAAARRALYEQLAGIHLPTGKDQS